MLFEYVKLKLEKRKAKRVFNEYSYRIDSFDLANEGIIQFANWKNPLTIPVAITQGIVDFFKQFTPKNSFAIDIGSNSGDTTVPMALAAGKNGLVIGFDPNPHVFKIFEANAGLNKSKTNIVALPYAITEKDGEFFYASSEASFSNGGISDKQKSQHGSYTLKQKIKGINLPEYLEKNYSEWLPKLSFIKIDTEGYDKEIILSIYPLIEKYKPVIVAECFSKSTKAERDELFDTIASKGYDLYFFGDFMMGTLTEQITKPDMMKWKHFNFIAVPQK